MINIYLSGDLSFSSIFVVAFVREMCYRTSWHEHKRSIYSKAYTVADSLGYLWEEHPGAEGGIVS